MNQFAERANVEIVEKTLNVISEAEKFNRWIYDTIKPFCREQLLEIGSGSGNISKYFLQDGYKITLSDFNQEFCKKLHEKFSRYDNLDEVVQLDISDIDGGGFFEYHSGAFKTIFAINVIEHIKNEDHSLYQCNRLLEEGGRLIIMVPAYQKMYNEFDRQLGHYRRYSAGYLCSVLKQHNFKIIHRQYFNFAGLLGWTISGSILRNKYISRNQMRLYENFVSVFKILDRIIFRSAGLSLIVVGEKQPGTKQ